MPDRPIDETPPLDQAPTEWVVPEERVVVDRTAVAPPGPPPPVEPPFEPPPDPEGMDRALAVGLVIFGLFVLGVIAAAILINRNGDDKKKATPTATTSSNASSVPTSSGSTSTAGTKTTPVVAKPRTPAKVEVPDVVGLSAGDAGAKLAKAKLGARSQEVPSRRPKGTVVSQSPAAGEQANSDRSVLLSLAKGPPPQVAIPDLVGEKRADAKRKLIEMGLSPRIHFVPAAQQPPGTVIAQYPKPGKSVVKGTAVRLNVGRKADVLPPPAPTQPTETQPTTTAPSRTAVPDVTGLDETDATSRLQSAGFRVDTTDEPTNDQAEDGTVLHQSPAGGSRATRGSTVTIDVARFSG